MPIQVPKEKIPASPVTLKEYGALDMLARRKVWLDISDISEAELATHMDEEKAREAIVPQPGQIAPDFAANVLDRDRKLTGETVTLSALRGKPVAIVFGSFT